MARKVKAHGRHKLSGAQTTYLEEQMRRLADRNPSCGIAPKDHKRLFQYLAVKKITYLYDDELFELLTSVDTKQTGKSEELLDAYLLLDVGNEIQLKLFQFKFNKNYDSGISTKELYAFVDRMNRVFLKGDLQDEKTLEAFKEVREALEIARATNPRARTRVQCYYIVNGQNISPTDAGKLQEIRDAFAHDRQTHGFTFETYGGVDIYNLCALGRVPIHQETLELDYDRGDKSILHHDIGRNSNGMPKQVVVGFVNVNQLIRLVDRYSNNELFEKNVRLFLGTKKDVNRNIIQTITSNESAWFGFMNNGVSITADSVQVDMPSSGGKVKMRLNNMQIINGCQTVNALYHAKYSEGLKDRFQGNSSVMVRVYQVDPDNKTFLDKLIVATNSQNGIRPEDLLSNDSIQRNLQTIYHEYGIGYERKEGEDLPRHNYHISFTKEQAGLAYLGVIEGQCSKLRNSLSRREFFREGENYFRVFNLRGEEGETEPGQLSDDFEPNEDSNRRALEILAARAMETECRGGIAAVGDKKERGALRKGAYYIARIAYLMNETTIKEEIDQAVKSKEREPNLASGVIEKASMAAIETFAAAYRLFLLTLEDYLEEHEGNEDAALKNTAFARKIDEAAHSEHAKDLGSIFD